MRFLPPSNVRFHNGPNSHTESSIRARDLTMLGNGQELPLGSMHTPSVFSDSVINPQQLNDLPVEERLLLMNRLYKDAQTKEKQHYEEAADGAMQKGPKINKQSEKIVQRI